MSMTVSDKGVALVARFEGFRSCPYRDVVGVWTIGYGETKDVGPHTKCISESDAKRKLKRRLNRDFGEEVDKLVKVKLSQKQFNALTSFAYNVGLGAFESSTLLRVLNQGKYALAANELLRWNRAGGRVLLGLTRRRKAERRHFLRGSPRKVRRSARRMRRG